MSLVINHNLMAMNAARNLQSTYTKLALSTQRLSSGLRVNSAADDAAGLAVREMMRSDIAAINQGVRNAGDAISLLQTAEGALSVVDEKLTRMKELAQQAATGSYTTTQRAIMDSEYQAMADEIDRIANATDFNGVKLLDGSITNLHGGSGMKIHFGGGNSSAEDYYYISIADMRATEATGLQIGGGATKEVWTASDAASTITSGVLSGGYFAYYYDISGTYSGGSYGADMLAGIYNWASTGSWGLSDVAATINLGTAARIFATGASHSATYTSGTNLFAIGGKQVIAVDDCGSVYGASYITVAASGLSAAVSGGGSSIQSLYISLINNATNANVWALSGSGSSSIMFMARTAGVTGNNVSAVETQSGAFTFVGIASETATALSGGGSSWAAASTIQSNTTNLYSLKLTGATSGANKDITVVTPDDILASYTAGSLDAGNYVAAAWNETQDASGTGGWNGADILTQSNAQLALSQIDAAINTKESTRAGLGSLANRLENTITNLQIQGENLQAAESRISDVDVATEMTEFTKNNILAQAATAMLAQANALPQLALQLLGGR
jgi:flagellin